MLQTDAIERSLDRIEAAARARKLHERIQALPCRLRAVLELVVVDDLSVNDAAAVLHISPPRGRACIVPGAKLGVRHNPAPILTRWPERKSHDQPARHFETQLLQELRSSVAAHSAQQHSPRSRRGRRVVHRAGLAAGMVAAAVVAAIVVRACSPPLPCTPCTRGPRERSR